VDATIAELQAKGVEITKPVSEERWGRLAALRLPSGAELGFYEPRHPLAHGAG
jgi:predicted enzyme related to lactoylglutathione lyase